MVKFDTKTHFPKSDRFIHAFPVLWGVAKFTRNQQRHMCRFDKEFLNLQIVITPVFGNQL